MSLGACVGCGKTEKQVKDNIKYDQYVQVGDYKGIKADEVTFEIAPEEIDQYVQEGLYQYRTYESVKDRGVEAGDVVVLKVDATIDGAPADAYSQESVEELIGEGFFYGTAEEQLLGMKPSETKTIETELDDITTINEEDFGKTITLNVTVQDIKLEVVPEYNDSFVKENYGFDTVSEYEESVKKELEQNKTEQYRQYTIDQIINTILDQSAFDKFPQEIYDKQKGIFDRKNDRDSKEYDMKMEDYLSLLGYTESTIAEEIIRNVNIELLLREIAEKENIKIEKDEIKAYVKEQSKKLGYENEEAYKKVYPEDEIEYNLLYQKVTDFLYEQAKLTKITEDEYYDKQFEAYEEQYYNEELDETELVDTPLEEEVDETEPTDIPLEEEVDETESVDTSLEE